VSFDVFFQGFDQGEPVRSGGSRMRDVLAPCIRRKEPDTSFLSIEVGDGTADVYLDDNDMLANHITGRDPWDLLVRGAAAAGWVILPVGCPTCLTHEDQKHHLPDELREGAVIVRSGADLLRVIETA
jgi:hypothetical protein